MSAQPRQRCYAIEPLAGGGWRLSRYLMTGGTRSACQNSTDYPADHRTDPTGEAAYEQALHAAETWRLQSPAPDRRADTDLRNALVRLRLAEFRAAEYLPTDQMLELTATIDSLVKALRDTGGLPQARAADSPNRPESGPAARRWPTLTLCEERAP